MKFQNQRWEGICLGSQHPLKQRSKNLHLNLKQSSHTPEDSSISFMPKTSHQNTWNGLPYCNVSMDRTSGVVQESSNTTWLDGTRYAPLLGVWKLTTFNHSLFGKWLWRFGLEENKLWSWVISVNYGEEWGGWCSKLVRGVQWDELQHSRSALFQLLIKIMN